MISWLECDPDITRVLQKNAELIEEVNTLVNNKLRPIESEYHFEYFHADVSPAPARRWKPSVAVLAPNSVFSASFAASLVGVDVFHGRDLSLYISRPGSSAESTSPKFVAVPNPLGDRRICETHGRISVVHALLENAGTKLVLNASIIILVFDLDQVELSEEYRSALGSLRGVQHRVRIVMNARNQRNILPVTWQLSRLLTLPELPKIFLWSFDPPETELVLCGCERDISQLYSEIAWTAVENVTHAIQAFGREASIARAHAAMMAYIKSQLPSVPLIKQQKQQKLVEDLSSLFPAIASKFNFPISDLVHAISVREKLRQFDFSRVKKVKEVNFSLVHELIDRDIPRLIEKLPDCEKRKLLQPESPHPTGLSTRLQRPPNLAEYLADFEALRPVDGSVSGPTLREHLVQRSKLPNGQLHKIWNLADVSCDGKLSLFEYALCRELIGLVEDGDSLPRILPMTVFS